MGRLEDAISALKRGEFIILHDGAGRENEADMVMLAEKITPEAVRRMRKDAGGLICVAIDEEAGRRLQLHFAVDVLQAAKNPLACMGARCMKYGDMPAFSISINHLSTFTGISDNDRAKTIREFARLVKRKGSVSEFKENFRAIGHVFILVSRGLEKRRGHTELSVELAKIGGLTPAMAICEMLSDSGKSASKKEAMAYAKRNGLIFIEGKELAAKQLGVGR
ncbi:MAG: 3,4-dihydroxy-2-butanone-4-phosphate synthase [Candidatus Micrarchaeota archaeon]|nr:3,4-dihydroxy-2-butanone-4-phosphate synthase [Candidatus Micrarchaeota archaeon]